MLHEKYLYDGWNLMVMLNGTNNSVVQNFMWGLDLSGTLQGAGGVGGLLYSSGTALPGFYAYDGNGNVAGVVHVPLGTFTLQYEYGPFGELLRCSGTGAKANPFRFSTKFQDDETDLLYYGYRYHSQSLGRWLNRDPIEERGGMNLYAFIQNVGANGHDILGRDSSFLQSWGWACGQLWDWATGQSPDRQEFGPNTSQSQALSQAPNAQTFESALLEANRGKPCWDWKGISNQPYRQENAVTDIFRGGVPSFVGSFTGTAVILGYECSWESEKGAGTVKVQFRAWNRTSLTSATYGLWPDGHGPIDSWLGDWNVPYIPCLPLPAHTYEQTYIWERSFNCDCPCN